MPQPHPQPPVVARPQPAPQPAAPVATKPQPQPPRAGPKGDPTKPIGPGSGNVVAKKYDPGAPVGSESADAFKARVANNARVAFGDDFKQFIDDTGGEEDPTGPKTPGVLITNAQEADWVDICRHFGLLPIGFDGRDKSCFITIDLVSHQLQKTTDFHFLKERYAANGMHLLASKLWSTPAFAGAAKLVCQNYAIPTNQLEIMVLAPRPVMSYMAWKSERTVRENGMSVDDVRAVTARFDRTSDGGWVLTITHIMREDGQTVRVRESSR